MNTKQLCTVVAATGLGLVGCGGGSSSSGTAPATTVYAPTDFIGFVYPAVTAPQVIFAAPSPTTSLTTDLGLGNATAFSSLAFGTGDAVPAGNYQAAVGCAQAGPAKCDPSVSVDLNSNLN